MAWQRPFGSIHHGPDRVALLDEIEARLSKDAAADDAAKETALEDVPGGSEADRAA